MKKAYAILLTLALAALTAACGSPFAAGPQSTAESPQSTFPESYVMLDAGEWPQNDYTSEIPAPESGTVSEGWINPDAHYCDINLTGVTGDAMESWYRSLLDNGFTEIEKTAEEIKGQGYTSTNALLKKGDIYVSMTHLSNEEGDLGICITLGNDG